MSNAEDHQEITLNHGQDATAVSALPAFDPARYRAEVDQFEISEQQKQELLTTLWSIMCSFVELGFTVDVASMLLQDAEIPSDEEVR